MGDKRQKQSEFWKTLIQKYETRNAQLAEKQCDLRHRLEAMECSMPALLCFNMMQMSHNNPDNDLKNFITQLQQPAEKPSGVLNINCTCDPCPIQQKESNNRQKYGNQSPCDCDPCPVKDCACGGSVTDTAHGAPIRENTSCQCDMNKMSAGDKQTPTNRPLNVRGDVHMQSCNCSPCPLSNQGKPATPTSNNMCGCNATANTKPSAGIETKCFCEPTCDCKSCPMLNKNSNQNGCGCNSPPTTNKIKPHSQSIQNCDSCGCNSSPTINNRVQHSQSTQNDDRCGCNSSPTTNNRAQYSQSTQNDDSCGCYSRPTTNMNNEHGCKCNPCPMTNNKQQPSGHDDSCACNPCPMTNDANTSPMECSCELECDCESCPMLNNSSSASSTSQDCACDSGQKSKYNTPKSPNMDLCKCNNCPAIETNTDRPMTSCDCNPGPSSSSPKTSQIASDRASDDSICGRGVAHRLGKSASSDVAKITARSPSKIPISKTSLFPSKSKIPIPIKSGIHLPGCECIDCLLDMSVKPTKKSKSKEHPPDCDCIDCLCNPCPPVGTAKQEIQKQPLPPDCDCPEYICSPCEKIEMEKPACPSACDCPECVCSPCGKEVTEKQPHPPDCNCPKCVCKPSGEEKPTHPDDCDCEECACSSCEDEEEGAEDKPSIAELHSPDCECIDCLCNPCVKKKPFVCPTLAPHPAACTCAVCYCDPCHAKKPVKNQHPDCCLCDPCGDVKDVRNHKPDSKCIDCTCDPCEDEKHVKTTASVKKHKPDSKCTDFLRDPCGGEEDVKTKASVKKYRPDCKSQDPNRQDIKATRSSTTSGKKHEAGCKCVDCLYEPYIDTDGIKKVSIGNVLTQHNLDCDCVHCLCETYTDVSVQESRQNSTECIREVCADKSPKISKHNIDIGEMPECDCFPQCLCEDCPGKKKAHGDICDTKNDVVEKQLEEMEIENKERLEEINELQILMSQIRCACIDAEIQATCTNPPEPSLIKKASSFKNTLSGLELTLTRLQDKCKNKDRIIYAMTQELRLRANSKIFDDMLKKMASKPDVNVDFDRQEVCDSLPRPLPDLKYGRKSSRLQTNIQPTESGECFCAVDNDSSPMKITNIKRMSPDSILIKWDPPNNKSVTGYEICINDVLKSRVHSSQRTSAIVFTLDFKNEVNIAIYAVTQWGRCEPAATSIYQV